MKRILLVLFMTISLTVNAQQGENQKEAIKYDSLLAAYKMDGSKLSGDYYKFLANYSKDHKKDFVLAAKIANQYISSLTESDLTKMDNVIFIFNFTNSTAGPGFKILLTHIDQFDAVTGDPDDVQGKLSKVIINSHPELTSASNKPDWKKLENDINKYGNEMVTDRTVRKAKMDYFRNQKSWDRYATEQDKYLGRYAKTTSKVDINNAAYDVFAHCNEPTSIQLAVKWMQPLMVAGDKTSWLFMDTYANLIYKLGRKEEAITWEEKALAISHDKDALDALNKMKKGEKTWE